MASRGTAAAPWSFGAKRGGGGTVGGGGGSGSLRLRAGGDSVLAWVSALARRSLGVGAGPGVLLDRPGGAVPLRGSGIFFGRGR